MADSGEVTAENYLSSVLTCQEISLSLLQGVLPILGWIRTYIYCKVHVPCGKGATTGGRGSGGPDPQKFGRTTPTFLMKSVITVT